MVLDRLFSLALDPAGLHGYWFMVPRIHACLTNRSGGDLFKVRFKNGLKKMFGFAVMFGVMLCCPRSVIIYLSSLFDSLNRLTPGQYVHYREQQFIK